MYTYFFDFKNCTWARTQHLAYPVALGELAGVVTAFIFVGRAYTVSAGAVTVASCATVATPSS